MIPSPQDKRTKSQILRLLDEALQREDSLSEQVDELRQQLETCRKNAEDPGAELSEEGMPASKIPFRIDYYKTAEDGPLKGIVEHLPSREKKAFSGPGRRPIMEFIDRFLPSAATEAEPIEGIPDSKEQPSVESELSPNPGTRLIDRLREAFVAEMI